MQEQAQLQHIPIKVYRSDGRLTIAAPMPGLQPEDIVVEVTADGRLALHGELRGVLKGVKELLIDEWSVGGYERELTLPVPVDAELATVTYGNGVLVITLPVAKQTRGARLRLEPTGFAHGERVGSYGHPIRAGSAQGHREGAGAENEQMAHGGMVEPQADASQQPGG